jgi:hypothetical protein
MMNECGPMVTKIDMKVDLASLENLFERSWTDHPWTMTFPTVQCGISVSRSDSDDYMESCQKWIEPIQEAQLQYLVECYKSTYLEQLINSLPIETCRWRWMIIFGKSCYSMHYDWTERIHIPIYTNNQSFLLFPETPEIYQLSKGSVYQVNTTKVHTAVNCNDSWRVHLVGCVKNNKSETK